MKKLIVFITSSLLFSISLTHAESLSDLEKNTDFAIWLSQQGHLFDVEYNAGLDPMEAEQRARFDYLYNLNEKGDPSSKIILGLLNFTDNALMNVDLKAVSKLADINETLLKLDASLGDRVWYQQLMTTSKVIIQSNFEIINNTVVPRDKKINPLYVIHNSTVHSDLIAGPYPEGSTPCSL